MNKLITKTSLTDIAMASAIAIFFTADRGLKLSAMNAGGWSWPFIGDILSFHFTANYYMAFSLPLGGLILNIVIALIIIGLAAYAAYLRLKNKRPIADVILILLIIAGAWSNLFDRLAYGYVIDYLELKYFTIFNLADVLITVSAGLLIWRNLRYK
jgi:signal peptidase II